MPECLKDTQWRDSNIDTLPDWHPCLCDHASTIDGLVESFREFAECYRDYLLAQSSEPREDLHGHVMEEFTIYLYRRFDGILDDVWGDNA